ncbi:MAG: UDP-N-acetylmuramate dehydrogenase [candidate division Zixibacteria bacterium]|nr:UDP-N-acetylmuramate dehydrogenase [candidate division Zixibacteria bacterium]
MQPKVIPSLPASKLIEAFGAELEFFRELAPLTSFETGGPARYFLVARSVEDVVRAVRSAGALAIPVFVMGGGSNLLVSDDGFDGLVIKLEIKGLQLADSRLVEVGGGEQLIDVVNFTTENSMSGLEFAAGIWGSVGGAIYGNAGAFGGEVGQVLEKAVLVDSKGGVRTESAPFFRFAYRHSRLKETHEIVASATFGLTPGKKPEIERRVDEILARRAERHPDRRTAGCFFRNIPDPSQEHGKLPAGKLLEEVGARELCVGGARVYDKHANIIVNTGLATSKDIRQLADMLKKRVLDRFGIELQEEVQQLGSFQ